MFEWDEAKRLSNLDKHGIDVLRIRQMFDSRPVVEVRSLYEDDLRFLPTGLVDGRVTSVVWTRRGAATRLISARRARDNAERAYRAVVIGGDR